MVHLLMYGFDRKAPTVADAREWAQHYGLDERENHVVLVGDPGMIGPASFRMIPGLQLVDRDFVLRYDGAGRQAPDDMWTVLLPAIGDLLED